MLPETPEPGLEVVEPAQMFEVTGAIRGICIAAQQNPRPAQANLGQHFQVPPRFHLDFDSLISGAELGLNFLQQLFVRVLNADGNAAGNLVERAAQQLP